MVKHIAVVAAVALLASCASEACPALHACDIRKRTCQREVADAMACLRGGSARMPAVEVIDAETFIASEAESAANAPDSADSAAVYRGLGLLRLMPESTQPLDDIVRERYREVAAFYSDENDKVTVLDRGGKQDSPGSVIVLGHEFIHAMQAADASPDTSMFAETTDALLALGALREGEAVLYQDLAELAGYGFDASDANWSRMFSTFRAQEQAAVEESDSPYSLAYAHFSYAFGGSYLVEAWRRDANAGVRALLAKPPHSTREVLAGPGAAEMFADSARDPSAAGVASLPEYDRVDVDSLGAWLFRIFLSKWHVSSVWDQQQLAGDELNLFRKHDSQLTAAVWRLRFEPAVDVAGLAAEIEDATPFSTAVDDHDLVLIAAESPELTRDAQSQLRWEPVPPAGDSVASAQPPAAAAIQRCSKAARSLGVARARALPLQ